MNEYRYTLDTNWDALLLNTAKRCSVTRLLSENFQDRWKCQGIRVINPFLHNVFKTWESAENSEKSRR